MFASETKYKAADSRYSAGWGSEQTQSAVAPFVC